MPATTITAINLPGQYSAVGAAMTFTALDAVNGNDVVAVDNMTFIVRNSGASTRVFAITSQPDPTYGRTGHVSVSIAAGLFHVFNLGKNGWADSAGKINFLGAHADLLICILKQA